MFGVLELSLFCIGEFWIANVCPPAVVCLDYINWGQGADYQPPPTEWTCPWGVSDKPNKNLYVGNMFMTAHSFVLIFSAGTIIRTFYKFPKHKGLLNKFRMTNRSQEGQLMDGD